MILEPFTRFPKIETKSISFISWIDEISTLEQFDKYLASGNLKSYGDVCLTQKGHTIKSDFFKGIVSFDELTGELKCKAGTTLEEIINFALPLGYFLPVTPGTKYVTIAGAVANDVHGKNHHVMGTIGCHVSSILLYKSDEGILEITPSNKSELFNATIGGLGLTGVILEVVIKLRPVQSANIDAEFIKTKSIDDFFKLNEESEKSHEYTVSWVDCTSKGKSLGKGIYHRGNHSQDGNLKLIEQKKTNFPLDAPFINSLSVKAFNIFYYLAGPNGTNKKNIYFEPFFYPLDKVLNWNKSYGKNGFLQYQFVIPFDNAYDSLIKMLNLISLSGLSSFLTVLKTFGDRKSPGMLSFPRKGVTMAIDFRYEEKSTLQLLDKLDDIVFANGGALYPCKDARMSSQSFLNSFPDYKNFLNYKDVKCESDFFNRVIKCLIS